MKALKIIAASMVLFNTLSALFGGSNLIQHPDGSSLSLSTDWLKHTPFSGYLVPGIVLLVVNGLFGIVVLSAMFTGSKRYPALVLAQGVLLSGWIVVQVMLIRTVIGLHWLMLGVGVGLTICGLALTRIKRLNPA